ncbi:DUF488 family protein [Aquihabitans daechungensis]|uniref:DUF488 domain-containing protein n=1 Tax=Aquihabitans daechungensis TaxID=1052257 RepID=UPI003BA093A2
MIYSVGYKGLTIEELVRRLIAADVHTVVDVRLRASSRRPGFAEAALARSGIDYSHERALGNEPSNREASHSGDRSEGRRVMLAHLEQSGGPALARVLDLVAAHPIALLCVEHDPECCHRQVVTDRLRALTPPSVSLSLPDRRRRIGSLGGSWIWLERCGLVLKPGR